MPSSRLECFSKTWLEGRELSLRSESSQTSHVNLAGSSFRTASRGFIRGREERGRKKNESWRIRRSAAGPTS